MSNEKIGLAVISYNRLDYLKKCIKALDTNNWGGAKLRIIIDDHSNTPGYMTYLKEQERKGKIVIRNRENSGVAVSKNTALKIMMNQGCEHLFLMEDDILMQIKDTCTMYIDYAKKHNLHHLNFALHGEMNKGKKFLYNHEITVYPQIVGAFSYYSKTAIETVGLMDENFKNAWEHVEHTYRMTLAQLTTPFWHFADHPISDILLKEIPGSIDTSSIRPRPDWQKNIQEGKMYWMAKHGSWLPKKEEVELYNIIKKEK